jgi:hypothetical protein
VGREPVQRRGCEHRDAPDQRRRDDVPDDVTDLLYVVMLGSDDALPMARVPDRVSVSPEVDFASGSSSRRRTLTN